jgi:diguanylate cyclase (GGDEF)-like protein
VTRGRLGPYALEVVALAVAYFVVAKLGLQLAFVKGNVTPVFPAAGLAVGALVVGGRRLWPGVFLGAFAAHLTTDVSVGASLAMSVGGPLAAFAAASVLRSRRVHLAAPFTAVRDATAFVLAGVLLPASISAACGVTTLLVAGDVSGAKYLEALGSWWVGDAIGAMTAGWLVLAWTAAPHRADRSLLATSGLVLLPVVITTAIFFGASEGEALLLPPLVAAAIHLQQRWTALCVGAVTIIAAHATATGHGPFVEATENASLVHLSVFLGVVSLTAAVLAAATTERDEAGARAHHDELTGLPNRRFLIQQMDAAIARRQPFTLLFVDIDGLKTVNDTLGHAAGDVLLVSIAHRITEGLRRGDFAARLAGDEYTVVAFGPADESAAMSAGLRVADLLAVPFEVHGELLGVTASIGAAICDGEGDSGTVLRDADDAMYRAKRSGGNQVLL